MANLLGAHGSPQRPALQSDKDIGNGPVKVPLVKALSYLANQTNGRWRGGNGCHRSCAEGLPMGKPLAYTQGIGYAIGLTKTEQSPFIRGLVSHSQKVFGTVVT